MMIDKHAAALEKSRNISETLDKTHKKYAKDSKDHDKITLKPPQQKEFENLKGSIPTHKTLNDLRKLIIKADGNLTIIDDTIAQWWDTPISAEPEWETPGDKKNKRIRNSASGFRGSARGGRGGGRVGTRDRRNDRQYSENKNGNQKLVSKAKSTEMQSKSVSGENLVLNTKKIAGKVSSKKNAWSVTPSVVDNKNEVEKSILAVDSKPNGKIPMKEIQQNQKNPITDDTLKEERFTNSSSNVWASGASLSSKLQQPKPQPPRVSKASKERTNANVTSASREKEFEIDSEVNDIITTTTATTNDDADTTATVEVAVLTLKQKSTKENKKPSDNNNNNNNNNNITSSTSEISVSLNSNKKINSPSIVDTNFSSTINIVENTITIPTEVTDNIAKKRRPRRNNNSNTNSTKHKNDMKSNGKKSTAKYSKSSVNTDVNLGQFGTRSDFSFGNAASKSKLKSINMSKKVKVSNKDKEHNTKPVQLKKEPSLSDVTLSISSPTLDASSDTATSSSISLSGATIATTISAAASATNTTSHLPPGMVPMVSAEDVEREMLAQADGISPAITSSSASDTRTTSKTVATPSVDASSDPTPSNDASPSGVKSAVVVTSAASTNSNSNNNNNTNSGDGTGNIINAAQSRTGGSNGSSATTTTNTATANNNAYYGAYGYGNVSNAAHQMQFNMSSYYHQQQQQQHHHISASTGQVNTSGASSGIASAASGNRNGTPSSSSNTTSTTSTVGAAGSEGGASFSAPPGMYAPAMHHYPMHYTHQYQSYPGYHYGYPQAYQHQPHHNRMNNYPAGTNTSGSVEGGRNVGQHIAPPPGHPMAQGHPMNHMPPNSNVNDMNVSYYNQMMLQQQQHQATGSHMNHHLQQPNTSGGIPAGVGSSTAPVAGHGMPSNGLYPYGGGGNMNHVGGVGASSSSSYVSSGRGEAGPGTSRLHSGPPSRHSQHHPNNNSSRSNEHNTSNTNTTNNTTSSHPYSSSTNQFWNPPSGYTANNGPPSGSTWIPSEFNPTSSAQTGSETGSGGTVYRANKWSTSK